MKGTRLRPFVALDGAAIPHWSLSHASRWGSAIAILERRSNRFQPDELNAAPELPDENGEQAHLSDCRSGRPSAMSTSTGHGLGARDLL
jgi:hypothetical protein